MPDDVQEVMRISDYLNLDPGDFPKNYAMCARIRDEARAWCAAYGKPVSTHMWPRIHDKCRRMVAA